MVFYTISTFRQSLAALTKKSKDGYMSVVSDICNSLVNMPDNILRDTNDRIRQFAEFRVVKLRLPNSGQHLPKNNGFRLIYWVSMKNDVAVLLRIYPKRGSQSAVDLTEEEYDRLLLELMNESKSGILHQVDVVCGFIELSQNGCLPGEKIKG